MTLRALLPDWTIHLRARRRSPRTITSYVSSGEQLCDWLDGAGLDSDPAAITGRVLEKYLADLSGRLAASTVAKHYRNLYQLFRWLVADGEIPVSPFESLSEPDVPEQPVPIVADETLTRLVKACAGNGFEARRDTALIRLLIDTGMRVSECAGLELDDIDQAQFIAFVMGKGGRGRAVPYGAKTADALRRYLRERGKHPSSAGTSRLWVGMNGVLTDSGIRQMLARRCDEAGVERIHPHQFRHTFAHDWLASGGQENDLMRLAGWRSREMVGRYGSSAAAERAAAAHRRMARGDRI